jgi:hypothetical protein
MIRTSLKFNKTTLTYFLIAIAFCSLIALCVKIIFPDSKKPSDNYTECNQLLNASAPISPSSVLNDKNDIQLLHARINGIKSPFATNAGFDRLITLARIVSSLRMELVITLMRLGLLLRRILLAQISSIRK